MTIAPESAIELFRPNNLSKTSLQLSPAESEAAAQVEQVLVTKFRLGVPDSIERIANAGVLSQNLIATFGDEAIVVKIRPGVGKVGERLELESNLAELLHKQGLPVPDVLSSIDGRHVAEAFDCSWVCHRFSVGQYYQGRPGELRAAAAKYAEFSDALRRSTEGWKGGFSEEWLLDDLASMVRDTPVPCEFADSASSALYAAHRQYLMSVINHVLVRRHNIEQRCAVMHTDFHPLNLLIERGEISAILDFEDIKHYPMVAASGFAAFKLARQDLVGVDPAAWACRAQELISEWQEEWNCRLPDASFSSAELGDGARYRVLALLHFMFDAWFRKKDFRFNFDLAKQLGSLYEIDLIFTPVPLKAN